MYRVPTTCGIVTDMTNLSHMESQFMDVLMGNTHNLVCTMLHIVNTILGIQGGLCG